MLGLFFKQEQFSIYKLLAETPSFLTVVTLGESRVIHGIKSLLYLSDIFLWYIVCPAMEMYVFHIKLSCPNNDLENIIIEKFSESSLQ